MDNPLILFDFDGTLVDSAKGITHAMKLFSEKYNHNVLHQHQVEPIISQGSQAMIKAIMGIDDNHTDMLNYRNELLELYKRHGIMENKFYPEVIKLLETLESHNYTWGIVSNGRTPMVNGTLANLNFGGRSAVTICADNVNKRKPDPEGVLKAAKQLHYLPENTIYIGDAITDIQAGNSANMITVAAAYGYVPSSDSVMQWGANHVINNPIELLAILTH